MTALREATRDELLAEIDRRSRRMPTPREYVTPDDLRAAYEIAKVMALDMAEESRDGDRERRWATPFEAAFQLVYGMTAAEWVKELRR